MWMCQLHNEVNDRSERGRGMVLTPAAAAAEASRLRWVGLTALCGVCCMCVYVWCALHVWCVVCHRCVPQARQAAV
jgi:hypothetical protein